MTRILTDNEKILTWLGYHEAAHQPGTWIRNDADIYLRVICVDSERMFLAGKYPANPAFDELVRAKVGSGLYSSRARFIDAISLIWAARLEITNAMFSDAWAVAYRPGDCAEAARFLWEKVDS